MPLRIQAEELVQIRPFAATNIFRLPSPKRLFRVTSPLVAALPIEPRTGELGIGGHVVGQINHPAALEIHGVMNFHHGRFRSECQFALPLEPIGIGKHRFDNCARRAIGENLGFQ